MEKQPLKSGYTTGTCAAAAAKAAAFFLLTNTLPKTVEIRLPGGETGVFHPTLLGEGLYKDDVGIQKDAGDDPDVTHKSWIYASVCRVEEKAWNSLISRGKGYEEPSAPGIYITGGTGIGLVTRQGLSCPPGKYAINPIPRRMIAEAVSDVFRQWGGNGKYLVKLTIPQGVLLAKKTFNPRLGIEGGISVLGTSGIVEPMSQQALVETIRLDIRMKCRAGESPLLITPGNYGERFLLETLRIPLGAAVKCSNFVGDAMDILAEEGAGQVLFVGHIGKLVKVAAGVKNTHSQYGDCRMESLAALLKPCSKDLQARLLSANTTEEALDFLKQENRAQELLKRAANAVKEQILSWTDHRLEVEVVIFSTVHEIFGRTAGAEAMIEAWHRRGESI